MVTKTKNVEQLDTSWAAIDSSEAKVFKAETMDYHGDDSNLDSNEQDQPVGKADSESALKAVSRRARK